MNVNHFNNDFPQKLNNTFHLCFGSKDALESICGLPADTACDMVVLSPLYQPGDILCAVETGMEFLGMGVFGESWLVTVDEKSVLWICTEGSAGSVTDISLALSLLPCQRILYLGESTALSPTVPSGSLIVPNKAICGTGATRYLCEDMSDDPTFLKERRTSPKGILWLSKAAIRTETQLKTSTLYSTDSIVGAMLHKREMEELGAEVMDRAATAFCRCMMLLNRPAVALLTVTRRLDDTGRIIDADEETLDAARTAICSMIEAMA